MEIRKIDINLIGPFFAGCVKWRNLRNHLIKLLEDVQLATMIEYLK